MERGEIYSMSADGSNITRITYTGGYYRFLGIDVTRRYIVVTKRDKDTGKKSLWLIDLRKGEEKRLTDPESNAEGDSFSPDGKWIVFEKPVKGNEENAGAGVWHIFKIRSDGTDLIDLREAGHTGMAEYLPSFSADGEFILFSARYDSQIDIFIMDKNGGSLKKLTDKPSYEEFAIWIK